MKTKTIFGSLPDLANSFNKIMTLQAIYLIKPVRTSNGTTVRIEAGNKIRVKDNWIIDISPDAPATHEVLQCKGNITSTVLEFELQDLETKEISTLKVK